MYEDLLKRLHAQELKMRRYHNVVGQPANRPLSLAGEAAAAIEALLAPKATGAKKTCSEKEIGPPIAALRCSAASPSAADAQLSNVRFCSGPILTVENLRPTYHLFGSSAQDSGRWESG